MSPIQQFANDVNAACPLLETPEANSDAWNVVSGKAGKEYYSNSPYATITAYERGFVVENLVVGSQHPAATWEQAISIRSALSNRYQTISAGGRF